MSVGPEIRVPVRRRRDRPPDHGEAAARGLVYDFRWLGVAVPRIYTRMARESLLLVQRLLADSAAEVDAVYDRLTSLGYKGGHAPWDALWGQRYAMVQDPDGNGIDLFAPLP
jgi:hypothetical protein